MKYEIENRVINTKDIIVDELGQRDVNKRRAQFNKIMRTFNPNLVNDIKVAEINGKFYCFDGQMTKKVLIAKNGGKDLGVNCKVYKGMTLMDAAEMFVAQNGTTSKVDIADTIRVMANYGDKKCIDFIRVTESNGLNLAWNRNPGKNTVLAVSTLFKIFEEFADNERYGEYISILKNAWGNNPHGLKVPALRGVSMFCQTYKGKFSPIILERKLETHNPLELMQNTALDRQHGYRKYAVQVLLFYNYGLTADKRLPNLL